MVIMQEIGAVEDTPDDLHFRISAGLHLPDQPIWALDPRDGPRRCFDRPAAAPATLLCAQLRRPTW
jgi:hypothetical protein